MAWWIAGVIAFLVLLGITFAFKDVKQIEIIQQGLVTIAGVFFGVFLAHRVSVSHDRKTMIQKLHQVAENSVQEIRKSLAERECIQNRAL